jgi:predicted RNA-binding Zn ribbon-like protein
VAPGTGSYRLAVELVNSWKRDHDALATAEQLTDFLSPYEDLWGRVVKGPAASDLNAIRTLRSSFRTIFEMQDVNQACGQLNEILMEHRVKPRVSTHGGVAHLEFEPSDNSIIPWIAATAGMGLATVVVTYGVDRFGVCGASSCDAVYFDNSRNHSRRYCSSRCSTREAVAAYRARQSI